MTLLDEHNRSKVEVTETMEATTNLTDGNNYSTTSLKRLLVVSVTFTFLTISAVMGLSFVLFAQRATLSTIVTVPLSLESMGPRIDSMQLLNSQGSHCLLESSLEAIQERVKNGDSVAMQLKGYDDNQFVAVAMDQDNDQCFINAQGRRVCVLPSSICSEEFPVKPRNRNLYTDEEYDIRCQAFIASNPPGWDYAMLLVDACVKRCDRLGCPCTCFNDDIIPPDFVVPEDFYAEEEEEDNNTSESPPGDDSTRRPCRLGFDRRPRCNSPPP